MRKQLFYAASTLAGAVIGAGILGIPFVVAKSGFLFGMIVLLVVAAIVIVLNLYMGEIALRTKGRHQLPGYIEKYLGIWGKRIMLFTIAVEIYGALLAYLIGEGSSFAALFGGSELFYAIIFFVGVSGLIYGGIKSVGKSELILLNMKIGIFVLLLAILLPHINTPNLEMNNPLMFFAPFGVILFAMAGMPAIPELRELLTGKEKHMKKAIIIGTLIPVLVYALFTLFVIGVSGTNVTEVATIGLGKSFGRWVFYLGNTFAILAMGTSFIALGLALEEMYEYDYGFKKRDAFILSCILPFILYIIGIKGFIKVLSITGVIAGGLYGGLITLAFWKAKKEGDRKPEYVINKNIILGVVVMIVYLIGAGYVLSEFIF